jgi:hypothetical protein
MAESAAARTARCEIRGDLQVGRRAVNWWSGRLVIDEHGLVVRSVVPWFIRARSASSLEIGGISVISRVGIHLPVIHWRRVDVVRFSADGPFADVSLKFPRRKRIAEAFLARGYSVTTLS